MKLEVDILLLELLLSIMLRSQSYFSGFVFKIRLIRLGFSFQKQKFLYLNSQPTDCQSRVISLHHRANCEWETQKSFQ